MKTPNTKPMASAMRTADFLFGGSVDLTRAHLPENRETLAFDIEREMGVAELELLRALENLTEKVRLAHVYGQTTANVSSEYQAALKAIARATHVSGEATPKALNA